MRNLNHSSNRTNRQKLLSTNMKEISKTSKPSSHLKKITMKINTAVLSLEEVKIVKNAFPTLVGDELGKMLTFLKKHIILLLTDVKLSQPVSIYN